jgi:hypothetical protein
MSALVFDDDHEGDVTETIAQLRAELGRRPGDQLHWVNLKSHSLRLHAARTLGTSPHLLISSVVVCKRHFIEMERLESEDTAYLYTFRYLLERLSWIARDRGRILDFTLAHIQRFPISRLRMYESALAEREDCSIKWAYVEPGKIDQPARVEALQLADLVASSTAAAFEPDQYGNTERRYLEELGPRLYRRNGNLLSYGMKLHPTAARTSGDYPWIMSL